MAKLWDIFAKTMGYIRKHNGIYWAKTMGFIGLRLKVKLWDVFGKSMVIISKNYGIYSEKV